ncbi:MAG: hypothetical protein ACI4P4_04900, partial [Faecousia sp.]
AVPHFPERTGPGPGLYAELKLAGAVKKRRLSFLLDFTALVLLWKRIKNSKKRKQPPPRGNISI